MNKIVVNSFPRTGNVFLTSIISEYFYNEPLDDSFSSMTKTILHDLTMLNNPNIDQVCILRDAREAIVSNKIYVNHNMKSLDYSLEDSALEWVGWHISFLRNMDHLYPLTFHQLINQTEKSLSYIQNTFSLSLHPGRGTDEFSAHLGKKNNVHATSKSSNLYEDTYKKFSEISDDIIYYINYLQGLIINKVKDRQNNLGWTFS